MAGFVQLVLVLLQEPPPVTTGPERHSAVRLQLSGHVDPHFFYRHGPLNEAGGFLNGAVLETGSTNAWSGRIGLRVDVEVKDMVTGVIEVENRNFDEGQDRPFSSDPETDELDIKQGYIEAGAFLSSRFTLRIGVQDITFRNRPHDEPFFMDLGEVEGFFDGFSATGGQIRNTVDRDVREAAGVRATYSPFEVLTLHAAWAVYGEGGGTPDDESVYLFAASALLSEHTSVWLLGAGVSGGDPGLEEVGTLGVGFNGYLGTEKELELFAEGYLQRGRLTHDPIDIRKKAFAFNGGSRYTGLLSGKLWGEAALSHRSGNRHVSDRRDQSFQSYENENRFLILQSSEFGLDVDANVTVLRIAVGVGPIDLASRPLRAQLDLGKFSTDAPLRAASGATLTRDQEDWGLEADLLVTWSYNESFQLWLKGAWLSGSDVLEALTVDRDKEARALVFGAGLKF